MATYLFACPDGHETELVQAMSAHTPETVDCDTPGCDSRAQRLYTAPAAVHFKGSGFYSTDVRSRLERRRRPNAGDVLHRPFDRGAAAIADSI